MRKKLKIRKSIAHRFRITKTGKVLYRGSAVSHLIRNKKSSRVRKQKAVQQLDKGLAKKIKRLLGVK